MEFVRNRKTYMLHKYQRNAFPFTSFGKVFFSHFGIRNLTISAMSMANALNWIKWFATSYQIQLKSYILRCINWIACKMEMGNRIFDAKSILNKSSQAEIASAH